MCGRTKWRSIIDIYQIKIVSAPCIAFSNWKGFNRQGNRLALFRILCLHHEKNSEEIRVNQSRVVYIIFILYLYNSALSNYGYCEELEKRIGGNAKVGWGCTPLSLTAVRE